MQGVRAHQDKISVREIIHYIAHDSFSIYAKYQGKFKFVMIMQRKLGRVVRSVLREIKSVL
jgi:hypothetical protein